MSKKNEILTIAREVIHSKGYKATSISDILNAADIGKGQFYYYFSSKRDLGLAVIDDLVEDWTEQLINNKLHKSENPKENLNAMLDWTFKYHDDMNSKAGCPVGNLAIEMSEHDEIFREKIQVFIDKWIRSMKENLDRLKEQQFIENLDTEKHAQAIFSAIEGAIMLTKVQKSVEYLKNVIEIIKWQYNLS